MTICTGVLATVLGPVLHVTSQRNHVVADRAPVLCVAVDVPTLVHVSVPLGLDCHWYRTSREAWLAAAG